MNNFIGGLPVFKAVEKFAWKEKTCQVIRQYSLQQGSFVFMQDVWLNWYWTIYEIQSDGTYEQAWKGNYLYREDCIKMIELHTKRLK